MKKFLKKYGLAAALTGMGVIHFAADETVEKIVPPQLPGSARFYNYASGVWEIATGALLAKEKKPPDWRVERNASVPSCVASELLPRILGAQREGWETRLPRAAPAGAGAPY